MYIGNFNYQNEIKKGEQDLEWLRWRTIVADFRNAHRSKKGKITHPKDLIRLPFDDVTSDTEALNRKAKFLEEAVRKEAEKIRKQNGKK